MAAPWPPQPASESDPTSSPRTALLSPPFGDLDFTDEPNRTPRGPGSKFRHDRERAHSTASARDLLQLLIHEEYESKQTRKILYTAFDRLEHETHRADAAEARIDETIQRARAINEARVTAEQQAIRAQEELKLYKLQLDNAQKEILRAQDVLRAIEAQRDEAEAAAVSARSKARRLNEERLIELAREEGRRLGFEEGVRRGRRMGYREAYDVGANERHDEMQQVVERLLEAREEPEQIEVLEEPTPIPPPVVTSAAPEVHRVETSVHSSLENHRHSSRSRRGSPDRRRVPDPVIPPPQIVTEPRIILASTTSVPTPTRPQSAASQPWPEPPPEPPFSRPVSVQNSPQSARRSETFLPDGYIPTADASHHISLPPPHELQRMASPTPSQRTLGHASDRGRPRDYMYDNSHAPLRRASPDESLASTKQSAASSISQLDLVGLPVSGRHRDRPQGLSVIHEDASMRSERTTDYSQTIAPTSHAGRNSFREMPSSETLRRESRKSKQQFADELRYSDPSAAEQWRRQSESSHSQQPRDGPPRHRPSTVTMPMPLSPPSVPIQPDVRRTSSIPMQPDERYRPTEGQGRSEARREYGDDGHGRLWSNTSVPMQPDSRLWRALSERQGRPEARSDHRDQRRPRSSDSSVPEISVEPPSGSPSIASSRGHRNVAANGLLSPDHANHPLPIPAPLQPGGRSSPASNSPVIPPPFLAGRIYASPAQDGQPYPVRPPSSAADGAFQGNPTGGGAPSQRYAVPSRPPSDRESGRPRTPVSFYAASPLPAGVTYPAPPISRSATYHANPYSGSNPSLASEAGGRPRRDSLSATAGMTPRSRAVGIPSSAGSSTDDGGGRRHSGRVPRRQSSASLGSRGRAASLYGGAVGSSDSFGDVGR